MTFPKALPLALLSATLLAACTSSTSGNSSASGSEAATVLTAVQVDPSFRLVDSRWDDSNTIPVRILVGPAQKVSAKLLTLPNGFDKADLTESDLARGTQGQLTVAKWQGTGSKGGKCSVTLIRIPSSLVPSTSQVAKNEAAVEVESHCAALKKETGGGGGNGGSGNGGNGG